MQDWFPGRKGLMSDRCMEDVHSVGENRMNIYFGLQLCIWLYYSPGSADCLKNE